MAELNSMVDDSDIDAIVVRLRKLGTKKYRAGMTRFAIPNEKAFGVPVGVIQKEAKRLGRNHALALALWKTGWYEARMLACFLDEPAEVTPKQMDEWTRDFDSWAICDTACFHLFDRTPHAWKKAVQWTRRKGEFEKRAGYALMASLALHDKKAPDEKFLQFFPLIERESDDTRNFVKKAVNWALRVWVGEIPR